MYPKPLHQIIQDYKQRENEGKKVNRNPSPSNRSIVRPFQKEVENEKTKRK